jgi:hypothetical protein
MDLPHPMLLLGIKLNMNGNFNMNGNKDAYFIEGSEFARYDSKKQAWVTQGDIIELSAKSSPCAFDQGQALCK